MIAIKFVSCSSQVNRPHLLILFIFTTSLNHTGSKLATAHLQCLHCPQRQYFQHEAQQQPLWKYLLSPPLKIPLCSWTPPFCDNQICHQDLGLWWILVSSTMRREKKKNIHTKGLVKKLIQCLCHHPTQASYAFFTTVFQIFLNVYTFQSKIQHASNRKLDSMHTWDLWIYMTLLAATCITYM